MQYRVLDTGGRVCSSYTEKKTNPDGNDCISEGYMAADHAILIIGNR